MAKKKEVSKKLGMPVFVYKLNPGQFGDGIYPMTACFPVLGVHVSFTFRAHSENDYLEKVHKATLCDGTCQNYSGHMEDFSQPGHRTDYGKTPIVKKAMAFSAKNAQTTAP